MEKRSFHVGEIISVTSGLLLPPNGMSGVHALISFMVGHDCFDYMLAEYREPCMNALLEQHPQIAELESMDDVGAGGLSSDKIAGWLQKQVDKFGERLEVEPLKGQWL